MEKVKRYVDGYVLTAKTDRLKEYKKMADVAGKTWVKHGALAYFECTGDDLFPDVGGMKMKNFVQLAKPKDDETVIFAFVIYKNKTHRNQVNKKVMADPEMNEADFDVNDMPFDVKKMAFGGFSSLVGYVC